MTEARPTRTRARRGEGDRLREELLAATEALLIETADESAVSIRAVAEAVGVSLPSIYRHFADKDDLITATCERIFRRLDDVMEAAAAGVDDPVEALARRGEAYVTFGLEHPESYRVLFMVRRTLSDLEAFDARKTAGSQAFHHLMEAAEAVLALLPEGERPDLKAFTCAIWTGVHGIVSLRIAWADFPWPPPEVQVAMACAGVLPKRPPTTSSTAPARRARSSPRRPAR